MKPLAWYCAIALFFAYFLAALAVSYPGLKAPMYYDSAVRIEARADVFAEGPSDVARIFPQRPLAMLSFYANYALGGMNPVYFRLVNLALLALVSTLVAAIIGLVLRFACPEAGIGDREAFLTAAAIGFLYLLHPAHTYSTLYIWQRMALLACLFSYASLAVYLATRGGLLKSRSTGYALCLVLFAGGMFSKENSVVLPLVFILTELAFFKSSLRDLAIRGAPYVLVTVALIAALSLLERPHGSVQASGGIANTIGRYYREAGISLWELILTQFRVLWEYVSIAVFPLPSKTQFITPQVVSTSILNPLVTAAAVVAGLALAVLGVVLLWKVPLVGFGILFFMGALVPESLLVPQFSYCGYRLTFPLLGLAMCVAGVWGSLRNRFQGPQRALRLAGAGLLALVVGFFVWSNIVRSSLWANPVAFWKEVEQSIPVSDPNVEKLAASRVYGALGDALREKRRFREAVIYHRKGALLSPKEQVFQMALAADMLGMGKFGAAETSIKKALQIQPKEAGAHKALGDLLTRRKAYGKAREHYERAVELKPESHVYQRSLAKFLYNLGDLGEALEHFEQVARLRPHDPVAQYEFGKALLDRGLVHRSIGFLNSAAQLKPDYWQAYNNLGVAMARSGRVEEAVVFFRRGLEINPTDYATRRNLETALSQLSKREGAR